MDYSFKRAMDKLVTNGSYSCHNETLNKGEDTFLVNMEFDNKKFIEQIIVNHRSVIQYGILIVGIPNDAEKYSAELHLVKSDNPIAREWVFPMEVSPIYPSPGGGKTKPKYRPFKYNEFLEFMCTFRPEVKKFEWFSMIKIKRKVVPDAVQIQHVQKGFPEEVKMEEIVRKKAKLEEAVIPKIEVKMNYEKECSEEEFKLPKITEWENFKAIQKENQFDQKSFKGSESKVNGLNTLNGMAFFVS